MAKQGVLLTNSCSVEEIIDKLFECGGIITHTAKALQISPKTLYEYMDIYPEIKEAQKEADKRADRFTVETAYDKVERFLQKTDSDPANAWKAIQFILSRSKQSRYYQAPKDGTVDEEATRSAMAKLMMYMGDPPKPVEE